MIFLLLLLFPIATSFEMRCYSGLKYVVGQDAYQDTENCDAFLGLGEAYCYKFMEETNLNEVVKMGCSALVCNAIRNRCMETDLLGMRGTICCCNDRHYCNSAQKTSLNFLFFAIFMILFFKKLFN